MSSSDGKLSSEDDVLANGGLRRSKEEDGKTWFTCATCGERWTHHGTAARHAVTHTDAKDFGCTTCGRRFRERSALIRHERAHTDERPFSCAHPGCEMKFRTSHNLTQHMLAHNNSRAFECGQCARRFRTRQKRDRHERTHLAAGSSVAGLSRHAMHACNKCGRMFATSVGCNNHQRACRATAITTTTHDQDIAQMPPTASLSTAILRVGTVLVTKQT